VAWVCGARAARLPGTLAVSAKDIRGGTPCVLRGDVVTRYCGRNAIVIHVALALCMPVLLVRVLWIHAAVHVQAAVDRHKRRVLQARAYSGHSGTTKEAGVDELGSGAGVHGNVGTEGAATAEKISQVYLDPSKGPHLALDQIHKTPALALFLSLPSLPLSARESLRERFVMLPGGVSD
jgi:hypothetical protein